MTTRRDFLARAGVFTAGAALAPMGLAAAKGGRMDDGKKLKLLILGGTGFLGPHIIDTARARGHTISMFNRGQTDDDLFPDIEWFKGDRYGDLTSLEEAVAAGRTWDAVIDTFTYVPKTVTDAMDVLLPAMGRYIVISTVSVYADMGVPDQDESGVLAEVDDATAAAITTHREVGQHYGAMKARVERAAEQRFPGRVANLRAGLIVGPRDTTGRYAYWPIRASEGGEMIAPGSGEDFVQYIDVRDLAEFTVLCAERGLAGPFNCVNPKRTWTARDMVGSAVRTAGAGATPVWIPSEFLAAQGVRPWADLPVWIPTDPATGSGGGMLDTSRGIAAGLGTRPIDETTRATLEYFRTRGAELEAERGAEFAAQWRQRIRGGLPREREAEVLAAWAAGGEGGRRP